MAVTAEGRRITEAHRLAQIDLAEGTMRDLARVWRSTLDPKRISRTFPDYFAGAYEVLQRDNARSAVLSAAYLEAFHGPEAEAVGSSRSLSLRQAQGLAEEQALRSLWATGPVEVFAGLAAGHTATTAAGAALPKTLRAAKRLALQGGRNTITETVQATDLISGVARVTDGDPCWFCAMLASRGAVYRSEETARFRPHDGCGCQPEPVYRGGDYKAPGRSREFSKLWSEIPGGLNSADSRRAFRGLYERGTVPDKYLRG